MKTPYNHCTKCQKWLGWPKFIVLWETKKLCSACQRPKQRWVEIF